MYFHQHYFLDYYVRDNVFNTPTKLFLDNQMRAKMFSILPPNYVLDYRVREIMFSILPPNEILDYRVREITLIVLNVLLWCSLQDKLQLCLTLAENRSLRWRSYVFIHRFWNYRCQFFAFVFFEIFLYGNIWVRPQLEFCLLQGGEKEPPKI